MMKSRRRGWDRVAAIVLVPLALSVAGCTATGMGWMQSAVSPTDKATFGFSFDGTTQSFSGSYHDPQGMTDVNGVADVAFKGTGKVNPCGAEPRCQLAGPAIKGGCVFGEPEYQSQNPRLPGSGLVFLEFCDADGDGSIDVGGTDAVLVIVDTGPYAGYANSGTPHGNITVRS
jgi:hypothetical protein